MEVYRSERVFTVSAWAGETSRGHSERKCGLLLCCHWRTDDAWIPESTRKGYERKDPRYAVPGIPSLLISYADAIAFLKALDGHGFSPFEIGGMEDDWKGSLVDVGYFTGPSKLEVTLSSKGSQRILPRLGTQLRPFR